MTDLCVRKAQHTALWKKKNLHGVGGMKEKRGRKTLYMVFAIIQVRGDEVLN